MRHTAAVTLELHIIKYSVIIHNVNITFKKKINAQFDASLSIQHNEFPGFHLFNILIFGYSDENPY